MSEEVKQEAPTGYTTANCCAGTRRKKEEPKGGIKLSTKTISNAPGDQKRVRTRAKQKAPDHMEAKVILLGNSGAGKSSIAHRYCKDQFTEAHDVTIGGAYMQQTVTLPYGT